MSAFTKPPKSHLMTYRIGRGEQGVLTYEPYKSYLLPHWRFRTVQIARDSSDHLWNTFLEFYQEKDFVGMDMTRKFIQMGMTRSKRYANYKGGKKYVDGKEKGNMIQKSFEIEVQAGLALQKPVRGNLVFYLLERGVRVFAGMAFDLAGCFLREGELRQPTDGD